MEILGYLVYVMVAFSGYMIYTIGFNLFVQMVLPWIIFMAVLFAPIVWFAIKDTTGKQ